MKSPARLSAELNQRLTNYALAAAAAGVATLACSVSAEAAPVCKILSAHLAHAATIPLNPTNRRIPPFNIAQSTLTLSYSSSGGQPLWWNRGFFVPNTAGANVVIGENKLAADLPSGASIGPGGQFGKGNPYGLLFTYGLGSFFFKGGGTLNKHRGNLNLLQSNYIGYEFVQDGQVHYGWARLRVTTEHETILEVQGWGYETSPNTAIAAGSCSAPEHATGNGVLKDESTPFYRVDFDGRQKSLGMLALGSSGLSIRR